jgi:hypothetical protein
LEDIYDEMGGSAKTLDALFERTAELSLLAMAASVIWIPVVAVFG